MIIRCALILLFLNCVRPTRNIHRNVVASNSDFERSISYSYWPSIHNAAKMIKVHKRDVQDQVISEGQVVKKPSALPSTEPVEKKDQITDEKKIEVPKVPENVTITNGTGAASVIVNEKHEEKNVTTKLKSTPLDLNSPGVVKRGLIVFGGFALLAVAYFIFYRTKIGKGDAGNNLNDSNQFRYGVLQSVDRKHNLELSRVPLTMESDEDEDEDMEIFDLGQKKKSLSYVNLQTKDEDIVLNSATESGADKDNLLLDIEDASTDTLINWSNNGNKSIL
ncbi:uncharacterized protein LOC131853202 [Achroia grisella]|uniref:uncharacterized protein LOC131853202 n=1 Tax=Achroia grisella TaxID=688607 RepID=UPI0027D1FC37|nr:uncharacterized protein LOC131853202 [Achroia grisella]